MTTLFNWSSHGGQDEDKILLQCSQHCHKGEFRHVSISAQQRSLRCGQNLCGLFLRATLPMKVGSCTRAMAINGKTKVLRTPPLRRLRWVSAQLLYVWVNARWRSRRCSQNLHRPFLWAVRFDYLSTLITLRYVEQFFPYQECNVPMSTSRRGPGWKRERICKIRCQIPHVSPPPILSTGLRLQNGGDTTVNAFNRNTYGLM